MKLYSSLLIGIIIFCSGCKRITVEKNSLPQGYSVAQIIGYWKVTAIESDKLYDWDGNGVRERDIYSTWNDCAKNNRYEFYQDATASYKITCSTITPGEWKLEGIVLEFIPTGSSSEFETIIALTSNRFETERTIQLNNSLFYKITKEFTRQ